MGAIASATSGLVALLVASVALMLISVTLGLVALACVIVAVFVVPILSAGARVLEAGMREALPGRTAVLVAHRLTTAAGADRVVVLELGRVVETGTPGDLARGDGPYARLWSAWNASR